MCPNLPEAVGNVWRRRLKPFRSSLVLIFGVGYVSTTDPAVNILPIMVKSQRQGRISSRRSKERQIRLPWLCCQLCSGLTPRCTCPWVFTTLPILVLCFHSKELKGANFISQIPVICQICIIGDFVCRLRVWSHWAIRNLHTPSVRMQCVGNIEDSVSLELVGMKRKQEGAEQWVRPTNLYSS